MTVESTGMPPPSLILFGTNLFAKNGLEYITKHKKEAIEGQIFWVQRTLGLQMAL